MPCVCFPPRVRGDLSSLYGFARLTDQLGDAYHGDRLAALDWLEDDLRRALAGEPAHQLVAPMAATVGRRQLDPAPLFDLIQANRQDQTTTSYATFDDLVAYCRLSADPVGRLVLGIFAQADPRRVGWSDAICTGLQLAEHWGDVAEDAAAGRVYLPQEDLDRFGVDPKELLGAAPGRPALRALMAFEVGPGAPLPAPGHPPGLVAAGMGPAGHQRICGRRVRRARRGSAGVNFDPLAGTPHRSPLRMATAGVTLWTRRATRGNQP